MPALLAHPFLNTAVPRPDAAIITEAEIAVFLRVAHKPPSLASVREVGEGRGLSRREP